MFVLIFMAFTTTSAAIGWPCNWALFLNFHSSCELTSVSCTPVIIFVLNVAPVKTVLKSRLRYTPSVPTRI